MSSILKPAWNPRISARENARRQLPAMAASYFAYVRRQLQKDPDPPKLHRLRLATKKLRYTLELFRPCYGPGLEERIGSLRKVQQQLGDTNDCVAAWDLLSKTMPHSSQRTKVQKFLDRRAEKEAAKFREQWQAFFEAPGREEWWTEYLSRPAGGARRKAPSRELKA